MGSLNFNANAFADHLHELVGYKAGIAVSIEHMCDLLSETEYPDEIISSEKYGIRIRSEEYEELYYTLLNKVGEIDKPYGGINLIFELTDKHRKKYGDEFTEKIFSIYSHYAMNDKKSISIKNGTPTLDPTRMIEKAEKKYGINGVIAILELLDAYSELVSYNPHGFNRWQNYTDIIDLSDLFEGYNRVGNGEFFDQRFINYLAMNTDKLGEIHWRKFEELIGECFIKFGYKVELGPGSNDDGVDLRVWQEEGKANTPEYIIQCKRQKKKIDKVTIKGLYADVLHEKAKKGLLITTSELSLGARKTVTARTYPIEEVNGEKVKSWLCELRVPGSGIVRI